MDWQSQLIDVYIKVCTHFDQGLCHTVQRMSNNQDSALTDQEVATIFLFGVIKHKSTVKSIYEFTKQYLSEWFPDLKGYHAFNKRLNRISGIFSILIEMILASKTGLKSTNTAIDSMPIIMAKSSRSARAKVAKAELANKGYCSSKSEYYYGVKLHVLGSLQEKKLPVPNCIGMTPASMHDLTALNQLETALLPGNIYADKAYADQNFKKVLKTKGVNIHTPHKLTRSKKGLNMFEKIESSNISSIRQPIEAFFAWLQEKTNIQNASKVRSFKGLQVHVFGRIAAAMLMFSF